MVKRFYDLFEEYLTCGFFLLIFLLMVGGVLLRYVFGISFAWNIELCRYSFVWLTFIGSAYVRRNDGHIKIDLFSNYLNKKLPWIGRFLFWIIIKLVSIIYLTLLIYFSYMLSIKSWHFKSQAMQIPQFFLYISVGIGSLMYIMREITDFMKKLKQNRF
ncbi:MAG: TRAP transporter small permease [Spirochaetales bacterium]|nr:TRAP transporter small permease [Spirochaetales bacterium]